MARPRERHPLFATLGHTTVALVLLTIGYYLVPLRPPWTDAFDAGRLALALLAMVVLGFFLRWATRRSRARQSPEYYRIQLLLTTLYVLVLGFALLYAITDAADPAAFAGMETRTDSAVLLGHHDGDGRLRRRPCGGAGRAGHGDGADGLQPHLPRDSAAGPHEPHHAAGALTARRSRVAVGAGQALSPVPSCLGELGWIRPPRPVWVLCTSAVWPRIPHGSAGRVRVRGRMPP